METFNVTEQQAEQIHGEGGSVGTEPAIHAPSSGASEPVTASASESGTVEAPAIAPDHEAPPKDDTPKVTSALDATRTDAVKMDAADAAKLKASFMTGRLLVKSPGNRGWHGAGAGAGAKVEPEPRPSVSTQRRQSGMAAVVALAALAGAVSGALATVGVIHFAVADAANTSGSQAVEASVSRIDADILALKAGLDHTTKTGLSQFNKTNDRLDKIEKAQDKIEKAQAEPSSKLAKLSEAMDRLRVPPAAAAPVAAAAVATPATTKDVATRDVTGSVTPSPANAAVASSASSTAPAAATPKTEVARLPTVDGWVLRDVNRGGALIEGRQGLYEVYAGDPVPGLGKVDAIRKQDGRWVVVTTKGLVVAR
jgi:hypothetical protein